MLPHHNMGQALAKKYLYRVVFVKTPTQSTRLRYQEMFYILFYQMMVRYCMRYTQCITQHLNIDQHVVIIGDQPVYTRVYSENFKNYKKSPSAAGDGIGSLFSLIKEEHDV